MHEYIAHLSDLLEHAHSVKAAEVGTNLLANQFIEGIDDTNKYMKNKLREKSGTNLDYFFQEAMRLQHKQEIRTIDFGPNLHTHVSECADINAIRSNNMACFNCKSPDHFVKDCPEPNKMQQPQSNNRQNSSIESSIEALTQTLKSLLSNQNFPGYSKPKQPFHHNRANPHAKPSFNPTYRPYDNKGQYFNCCPEQEDLISFDPSEDQTKKLINLSQCKDFEELGGQHYSDPTFDNVHNSSISDCTDIKQTIDNSDIGYPNKLKTETIDDNMQDQTSNIDNEDQGV